MEREPGAPAGFDPVERVRLLWVTAPGARRVALYLIAGLIVRYLLDGIRLSGSSTVWAKVPLFVRVLFYPVAVMQPAHVMLVVEVAVTWLCVAFVERALGRIPWTRFLLLIAVAGGVTGVMSIFFGDHFWTLPGPLSIGLLALGLGAGILRRHRLDTALPLGASQVFFGALVSWIIYADPTRPHALVFALVSLPLSYLFVRDLARLDVPEFAASSPSFAPPTAPQPSLTSPVAASPVPAVLSAQALPSIEPTATPDPYVATPLVVTRATVVGATPFGSVLRRLLSPSAVADLRRARLVAALLALALVTHLLLARNVVPMTKSASVLARNAMHRIVSLACENQTGTGFFVASGLIVTNAHVACASDHIDVVLAGGERVAGKVVHRDRGVDLAAIRVDPSLSMSPLPLGDTTDLRQGETIYVLGNPLGLDFSISRGIVSNAQRNYEGHWLIQIDAPVNPGNSGGPVLNELGEVVGIVRLSGQTDGIGFAIPVNYVYRESSPVFLSELSPRSDDVVPEMEALGVAAARGASERR